MKRIYLIPILCILLAHGCKEDPGPQLPDPIYSYYILYNFLSEPYDVAWEVGSILVDSTHTYGAPYFHYATLPDVEEDVTFTVKESGTSTVIQSENFSMEQDHYYIVALLGSADNPQIIFEPIDYKASQEDLVKIRFMVADMDSGPLDIYMGGNLPEHRVLSDIAYGDITDYIEIEEGAIQHSLVITPLDVSPLDSTILSYTQNDIFAPLFIYLGVIGHISDHPSSNLELLLYDQPVL